MSIRFPYPVRLLTTALEWLPMSFLGPNEGFTVHDPSALPLEHIFEISCTWLYLAYDLGIQQA
jgi:hypothetical protein